MHARPGGVGCSGDKNHSNQAIEPNKQKVASCLTQHVRWQKHRFAYEIRGFNDNTKSIKPKSYLLLAQFQRSSVSISSKVSDAEAAL